MLGFELSYLGFLSNAANKCFKGHVLGFDSFL